jgi:hypothetical protein
MKFQAKQRAKEKGIVIRSVILETIIMNFDQFSDQKTLRTKDCSAAFLRKMGNIWHLCLAFLSRFDRKIGYDMML